MRRINFNNIHPGRHNPPRHIPKPLRHIPNILNTHLLRIRKPYPTALGPFTPRGHPPTFSVAKTLPPRRPGTSHGAMILAFLPACASFWFWLWMKSAAFFDGGDLRVLPRARRLRGVMRSSGQTAVGFDEG